MSQFAQFVTGTVVAVEYHGNTANGNQMKSVKLSTPSEPYTGEQWFRISNDASLAIGIENSEWADQPHDFELTRAGRLSGRTRESYLSF